MLHFYSTNLTISTFFRYHGEIIWRKMSSVKNGSALPLAAKFWQIEAAESRIFKPCEEREGRYEERFHSFRDIYLFAAKNGQPIWHYFSRQTDFIDLPLLVALLPNRSWKEGARGRKEEGKRG